MEDYYAFVVPGEFEGRPMNIVFDAREAYRSPGCAYSPGKIDIFEVQGTRFTLFNERRGGCSFRAQGDFQEAVIEAVSGQRIPIIPKADYATRELKREHVPQALVDLARKENLKIRSVDTKCVSRPITL